MLRLFIFSIILINYTCGKVYNWQPEQIHLAFGGKLFLCSSIYDIFIIYSKAKITYHYLFYRKSR